jgi:transposase
MVLKKGSLYNERNELAKLASVYPGALLAMEAGTHSPWISRFLDSLGMEVLVANPRKIRTIWQNERKSDERDALVLARLARADRNLLSPIVHTIAKKPSVICSKSNCETAWYGRAWR